MTTGLSPLKIPQIGRDQFLLQNHLYGQSRQVPLTLGEQSLSVALNPVDSSPVELSGTNLVLGTGAHTLNVLVSHLHRFQTMGELLGDAELQTIPTSILSAMVEVCFEPALSWLRDALGASLELQTVELKVPWRAPEEGATFQFELSSGASLLAHILITIPEELLELANSLLERIPVVASRSLADVTIPLTAVCGSVELSLDDLQSLRRDDLLILDTFEPIDAGCALVAGGCEVGRVQMKPGSVQVIEVAQQPFQKRRSPLGGDTPTRGGATLKLDVVRALGGLRLEQLAQLQQETDITVQTLVNERVALWSAANPLGHGCLVSLGNGVAVRVLSFETPADRSGPAAA
jgi:type III secretion protein Q